MVWLQSEPPRSRNRDRLTKTEGLICGRCVAQPLITTERRLIAHSVRLKRFITPLPENGPSGRSAASALRRSRRHRLFSAVRELPGFLIELIDLDAAQGHSPALQIDQLLCGSGR